MRHGDIAERYVGISKANKELSWTGKRGIVEIFRDAWWFEKRYKWDFLLGR